jgi:hypothetical protein
MVEVESEQVQIVVANRLSKKEVIEEPVELSDVLLVVILKMRSTNVQPMFNQCSTNVQPMFNQCSTNVQPMGK